MSIVRKRGMTYSLTGIIAEGKVQAASLQVGSEQPATKIVKVATKALTGTALHAANLSWQNPESVAIIILRVVMDITTPSAGASTIDTGVTETSATTPSDTLLDGVSGAAAAVFDSMNAALDGGANAKAQKLAAGKWVTFDEASGDVTGLVANAYIHYHTV